ncbi:MAG: heparinase II/III family protein, partial [Candidatus Latescibacteria bacterium]|nr:heparinase II/III family protein [Candidatus Latescibacterota bacterium]
MMDLSPEPKGPDALPSYAVADARAPVAHPAVFITADDIERARRNIDGYAWAKARFEAHRSSADRWLAMSDDDLRAIVPHQHALFDKRVDCPVCGSACETRVEWIGRARCPDCERDYPDAEHPDDGSGWRNPDTGKTHPFVPTYNEFAVDQITDHGLGDLAICYAVTGDESYARTASVLFDALAHLYPTADGGPMWYPHMPYPGGGRLNRPQYQTSRMLIFYSRDCDLLYGSEAWDEPSVNPLCATRRENVEVNLLINGAEYCYGKLLDAEWKPEIKVLPSFNNAYSDYLQGIVSVGCALGISHYIDYALEGKFAITNFLDNALDRESQYIETSFGTYSTHTFDLFMHHAEMLYSFRDTSRTGGLNLYTHPKFVRGFLRSDLDLSCAGHSPPVGDCGPDLTIKGRSERSDQDAYTPKLHGRLELLIAKAPDAASRQEYQAYLYSLCEGEVGDRRAHFSADRLLNELLLFRADPVPEPAADHAGLRLQAPLRSTALVAGRNTAILRKGTPDTGEMAALLRCGQTLNHGHYDELNLNLFALGREITYDPGYGDAQGRFGVGKVTGTHNLVMVNETCQLKQEGTGGNLTLFCEAPFVRVTEGRSENAYGSEDLSMYRRTVALVDLADGGGYVLDIFRVAGGHTHDFNYHFIGDLAGVEGIELSDPEDVSLAGPQYRWYELLDENGRLEGMEDVDHYWAPPPGNGYGFLHDLRRGEPGGSCTFTWDVESEDQPEENGRIDLTLVPPEATEVILARCPGISARHPGMDYAISRRKGRDLESRFVAIVEPRRGSRSVKQVEELRPSDGSDPGMTLALKVEIADGTVDYLFSACEADIDTPREYVDGDVRMRFSGQFGALRKSGERIDAVLVQGSELSAYGLSLSPDVNRHTGLIDAIDHEKGLIHTLTPLPADGSLDGRIVSFSRPEYTRDTLFTIERVVQDGDRYRIDVRDNDFVMSRGMAGIDQTKPGRIPNCLPLDWTRTLNRSVEARYFTGKLL